jgi:hypothetical protein
VTSSQPHQLTPTEVKRKKGKQAYLSAASGSLGLASLGAFAASKAPSSKHLTRLIPITRKINPHKAQGAALGLSTTGAGVGGIGSLNFAPIMAAEAHQKRKVRKSMDPSPFTDGFYGAQGDRVPDEEIERRSPHEWSTKVTRGQDGKFRSKVRVVGEEVAKAGNQNASAFGVVHD